MRTTFYQFRISRIPQVLGSCASDAVKLASILNEAIHRLMNEAGETGWWGTWQKTVFNVNPSDPYITLPRSIARIINLNVCKDAVRIRNEFYEFMEAGIGLQPTNTCNCSTPCNILETYDRGTYPTMRDLNPSGNPKFLRLYPSGIRDVGGVRVLIQGLDLNGHVIRSLDNGIDIEGEYVVLRTPFADTVNHFSSITGIQKDISAEDVSLYQVDAGTGAQVLLSRYESTEENPAYRRYFINGLPVNCCDGLNTAQVTCMAKLEYIPLRGVDQEWLLIGNIPALKKECESVWYEEHDIEKSQQLAALKHKQAIRMLNAELAHYVGRLSPIVNFAPFGNAHLRNASIGMT